MLVPAVAAVVVLRNTNRSIVGVLPVLLPSLVVAGHTAVVVVVAAADHTLRFVVLVAAIRTVVEVGRSGMVAAVECQDPVVEVGAEDASHPSHCWEGVVVEHHHFVHTSNSEDTVVARKEGEEPQHLERISNSGGIDYYCCWGKKDRNDYCSCFHHDAYRTPEYWNHCPCCHENHFLFYRDGAGLHYCYDHGISHDDSFPYDLAWRTIDHDCYCYCACCCSCFRYCHRDPPAHTG